MTNLTLTTHTPLAPVDWVRAIATTLSTSPFTSTASCMPSPAPRRGSGARGAAGLSVALSAPGSAETLHRVGGNGDVLAAAVQVLHLVAAGLQATDDQLREPLVHLEGQRLISLALQPEALAVDP